MTEELKVTPIGDKVIISVIEEEEVTSGGIFLPGTSRGPSDRGVVLAVGEGRTFENGDKEPLEVKVGDNIIFIKGAGIDIKHSGIEYKILSSREILVVITE